MKQLTTTGSALCSRLSTLEYCGKNAGFGSKSPFDPIELSEQIQMAADTSRLSFAEANAGRRLESPFHCEEDMSADCLFGSSQGRPSESGTEFVCDVRLCLFENPEFAEFLAEFASAL